MRLKDEREELELSPNTQLYPRKMILKHGVKHVLLDTKDIVFFFSNNKIVYVIDADNQKYMAEKNLCRLEAEIDPRMFFKVNRTHIVNFNFIRSFATFEKNKIRVELKTPKDQSIVISQTRVQAFKEWLYQQL